MEPVHRAQREYRGEIRYFQAGGLGRRARGRHLEWLLRYRCWRQHSAVGTGRPANWVTQQHLGRKARSLLRAENILARDEDGQWQAAGRRTPSLVKAPALHLGALGTKAPGRHRSVRVGLWELVSPSGTEEQGRGVNGKQNPPNHTHRCKLTTAATVPTEGEVRRVAYAGGFDVVAEVSFPRGSHAQAKGLSEERRQDAPRRRAAYAKALRQDGVWGILGESVQPDQTRGRAERSVESLSKRCTITDLTSHLQMAHGFICQPCPDGSQACTSNPDAKLTPTLTVDVGTGLPNRALKLNWSHPGSSLGLPASQKCQQHPLGCGNLGAILLSSFSSPLLPRTLPLLTGCPLTLLPHCVPLPQPLRASFLGRVCHFLRLLEPL